MTKQNKPVIETVINTAAIALTAYGTLQVTSGSPIGYLAVCFGVALELLKYHGRKKEYW